MENYKFSVPIRINYVADESTISIENLEDLEDIQEKYSVDLEFIIDEYEYKIEIEKDKSLDEDEDYFGMSEYDIFNGVISDNWNVIVKKINKDCKLDDLCDEDIDKLFNITKEDFNKNVTIIDHNDSDVDYILVDISMTGFNRLKSEFYVEVGVDKKLKKEEIESVRNWVETQTAEDWGVKFSKTDLSDKLEAEDIYVYLTPWSLKKDVKYVKS